MSLFKTRPFNTDISSKKLNKALNFQFDRGWSPIIVPYVEGDIVVLQLYDWVGGEGEVPIPLTIDYYLGENGLVTDVNDAINIAEGYISSDYKEQLIDWETMVVSLTGDTNSNTRYIEIRYDNILGTGRILPRVQIAHTKSGLLSGETLDINIPITLEAVNYLIDNKAEWLVIDDSTLSERAIDRAASQKSVYEAIENAKARFDVPIIDLDSAKIAEIQSMSEVSSLNPYYAMVGSDNRTGGIYSAVCDEPAACGCSEDGGYEEMGYTAGITGCVCVNEVSEVNATCHVSVTTLGVEGDTHTIVVNGVPIMWYTVGVGDTLTSVVNGLIGSLPSVCGGGSPICNVANITTDSFDLIAVNGLGATPNSWTKIYSASGTASGSITVTVPGVDYVPATYRGVKGHLIAYDGNQWYDFGGALSGVSETTTTITVPNVGIKYYIESTDEVMVPNYYQYIVHENLIVDGVFTLEDDAELIIINN